MNRLFIFGTAVAALFAAPVFAQSPNTLLNASYDVAREVFAAENEAFVKQHPGVTVDQSHAGTSKQARAIAEGLDLTGRLAQQYRDEAEALRELAGEQRWSVQDRRDL